MSSPTNPPVAPQPDPATDVIAIEAWAAERSRTERRVELLNAFVTTERAAGRYAHTRQGWDAAYAAFGSRQVS